MKATDKSTTASSSKTEKFLSSKKGIAIIVMATLVIGFGSSYAFALNKKNDITQKKDNIVSTGKSNCDGTCVALEKDKANPNEIAVTVGSFVQFNSADGQKHRLSVGEGGEEHEHSGPFSSGDFGADEAWRVEFKDEGSYTFHDHYNPNINIVVVVYTPGKDYKIER